MYVYIYIYILLLLLLLLIINKFTSLEIIYYFDKTLKLLYIIYITQL